MAATVAACGPAVVAPVRDSGYQPPRESKVVRIVRKGDTLYSIAFSAGLDYRAVARWNGIDPPYVIKPGQKLRLRPPPGYQPPVAGAPRQAPSDPAAGPEPRVGEAPQPAVAGWMWPTRGRIISKFAPDNANPGIDIAGESGQTVRSAADGRVVYSGDGLRGYGKLIIVKHNETFLSAYAHNRKLLVQEGDQVNRGQPIAEMGSTDTDRVRLHFEIRKRGTAVNPLNYLPKT